MAADQDIKASQDNCAGSRQGYQRYQWNGLNGLQLAAARMT
jgi:hypothetical protein